MLGTLEIQHSRTTPQNSNNNLPKHPLARGPRRSLEGMEPQRRTNQLGSQQSRTLLHQVIEPNTKKVTPLIHRSVDIEYDIH
jgi:hypothetical protein